MKNKNVLTDLSQNLRKNMTPEESHLWYDFLKQYPIQFKRQKVLGRYILDFYCHKAKTVIEIDGSQHFKSDAKEYDNARTEFLEEYGLIVIRFSNKQVNEHFYNVCQKIDRIVKERIEE